MGIEKSDDSDKCRHFLHKLLKVLFPKDEQIPYVEGYYDNSPHSKSYNNKYRNPYFVGYYTFSDLEDTIGRTIARNNKNTSRRGCRKAY